jgi:hypothetical protein
VRLGIGLVALWAGLATAFAFIFLDAKPKIRRLWVSRICLLFLLELAFSKWASTD